MSAYCRSAFYTIEVLGEAQGPRGPGGETKALSIFEWIQPQVEPSSPVSWSSGTVALVYGVESIICVMLLRHFAQRCQVLEL